MLRTLILALCVFVASSALGGGSAPTSGTTVQGPGKPVSSGQTMQSRVVPRHPLQP